MKTFILGLCLLGITNLINAQNDFAMVVTNHDNVRTNNTTVKHNSSYLNNVAALPVANRVMKLQQLAANYNIKSQAIYSTNKNITYDVLFEDDNNYIQAVYNTDGTIISCEEYYTNINMPYSVSGQLAKDYPGWAFNKITYTISYSNNKAAVLTYHVELKKGKQTKMVKITS